jgi:hypothetical protein
MDEETKENLITWFASIGLSAHNGQESCEQNDFDAVELSLYILRQKLEEAERAYLQATGKTALKDFSENE